MKVRDVMQTSVVSVDENSLVKHVARLIFTGSIYSFPVVRDKKLVGFITEEDIFFGMDDTSDRIKYSKEKLLQILETPVKSVMVKKVISVNPEISLVEAQTLMYRNKFAQLPVIDEKNNLVGIVTRANIFRHVLEEEIPKLEQGQYASFMTENYDIMTDWDKREDLEFPTLFRVFKRANVKKIIDLGSWTGEYAIRLARAGIDVVGLDQNPIMVKYAGEKREKLPDNIKKRVSFELTDFTDLHKLFKKGSVDGVIGLGTSLAYLPLNPGVILKNIHPLIKKDGVIVLQLLNLERIVEHKGRLLNFRIKKVGHDKEELFIEFFDKKNETSLMHNVVNFMKDGERWIYAGINSIEIAYVKHDQIISLLREAGFSDITITGNKGEYRGQYGQMSLIKPFDPKTSEWMTVFAKA